MFLRWIIDLLMRVDAMAMDLLQRYCCVLPPASRSPENTGIETHRITVLRRLLTHGAEFNEPSFLRLWLGRLFCVEFCGNVKLDYAGHDSILLKC